MDSVEFCRLAVGLFHFFFFLAWNAVEPLCRNSEADLLEVVAHGFRYFGDEVDAPPASSDKACQPGFDITILSMTSEITPLFV